MLAGRAWGSLLELCYPATCARCGSLARSGRLCPACEGELDQLEAAPACVRCAMPLAQAGQPCPYCQGQGLRPLERVVRLGVFEDPLKHLVHRMKYNGDWTLAEMLADRLCAHEPARDLLAQADVLVPVPLHPLRQVVRGYNQAQVIAARLVRSAKPRRIAVVWPAARTRDTGSQTRLSSNAQRVQNMRQAFALVRPELVADRHVVLVDDVMTSGATLRSLARALRRGRPKRLSAILLAIADPRGRGFEAI